ncbi:MAG TPA: hypothetical protein DIU09_10275 [Hyphomonadaceae bacterium]|nr:hypothetical protein AEM38_13865 [Hyphomonadaceae bacterium UKL13-1]HCP64959.1 hypothetical protein [Hyphomonadaceae bacterium]
MGAIFGRFDRQGAKDTETEREMVAAELRIWGPDSFDQKHSSCSFIAQSTLVISPHAVFEKIVVTPSGFIVSADAIIDNRAELLLELDLLEADATALSDTALIALAWEKWREACVSHIVGDFAFSVFHPDLDYLFLVRDHIGTRPLFWAQRNDTLVWSTSAKVIVSHREWTWPIDDMAILAFQASPESPLPDTFYQDLHTLKPGNFVSIDHGQTKTVRWWNPTVKSKIELESPEDYARACRAILERAIQDRCHTSHLVGAHLSGGIDSTGVAVLASRYLKTQNKSLCGGYTWSPAFSKEHPDYGPKDERRRIALVGEQEGIPIKFGRSSGSNIFEFFSRPLDVEGIADLADELPTLSNASKDGARVVLSGWGGDEGFSSHGFGYLGYLIPRLKLRNAANFIRFHTRGLRNIPNVLSMVWRGGFYLMLPDFLHNLIGRFQNKVERSTFMRTDVFAKNSRYIRDIKRALRFYPDPAKNIKACLDHGHIGMRMETWAAWSAPHQLQYRYPLTDRRLLEFLMMLPPEALLLDDRPRGLSLRALEDVIPPNAEKHDLANEKFRRAAREESLQITMKAVRNGLLSEDCPWFNMQEFRDAATSPADQSTTEGVMKFAEVMTAMRLWFFWRRGGQSTK